jgi:hypothetical protein
LDWAWGKEAQFRSDVVPCAVTFQLVTQTKRLTTTRLDTFQLAAIYVSTRQMARVLPSIENVVTMRVNSRLVLS